MNIYYTYMTNSELPILIKQALTNGEPRAATESRPVLTAEVLIYSEIGSDGELLRKQQKSPS